MKRYINLINLKYFINNFLTRKKKTDHKTIARTSPTLAVAAARRAVRYSSRF